MKIKIKINLMEVPAIRGVIPIYYYIGGPTFKP